MENFEKLVLALAIFVITSVIAYLFRMRQLYVVAPKLYRHAAISKDGSLCEIIVYNKGNQAEENIQVEIDPDLKCELLASSSSSIELSGSTIKIDRLHKGEEGSAILLIEKGLLDFAKITSVSSKGTKGTVCKKITDVPPNYAILAIVYALALSILPAMIYGGKGYTKLKELYTEHQLESLYEHGWSNLEQSYASSDLRKSYSDQEFPAKYIDYKFDGNELKLRYEIYNKTSLAMEVYVRKDSPNKTEASPYFSSVEVPAMSKKEFAFVAPKPINGSSNVEMMFTFKVGEEYVHWILSKVELGELRTTK